MDDLSSALVATHRYLILQIFTAYYLIISALALNLLWLSYSLEIMLVSFSNAVVTILIYESLRLIIYSLYISKHISLDSYPLLKQMITIITYGTFVTSILPFVTPSLEVII